MPKNNKGKKIKIRVADIVSRPQKAPIKKGKQKTESKNQLEKIIQIEIPQGAAVTEPAIINVVAGSKENILKEMAGIEKRAKEFEKNEEERFVEEEKPKRLKRKMGWRGYAGIFSLVAVLGVFAYAAAVFLPKADIQITTTKTEWKFNDTVLASKKVSSLDIQSKTIPGEIFSEKKSFTYSFPATGKNNSPTGAKATGKITIWNNGPTTQKLVVKTRFETPDGKIFKLDKAVTVPPAKTVSNKIVATSVDANVTADQAGEAYNIGPVARFTVPGLKGLSQYSDIYGSSSEPMTGGTLGQFLYPADQDIKNAEAQSRISLKQSLDSLLKLNIPSDFVLVDGSEDFKVTKDFVNKSVDQNGNASIILDGQISAAAFRKSDVLDLMKGLANPDLISRAVSGYGDFETVDYKIDYSGAKFNADQGQLSFTVNFSGNFWQPIKADEFIPKILGKNETDLRKLIYSLPAVEKATISFWPFWVQSVTSQAGRVTLEVK
ncbi:MAG: hypothetical protein NTW60_02860 [Candidatus Wolfebacteria bacterium]|nr:hypothetical protein [Candidatus Wolfebacteria bacterium]